MSTTFGAVDLRPRHVRRVGAERGLHLARPGRSCPAWFRSQARHRRGRRPSRRTPPARGDSAPERRSIFGDGTPAKLLPAAVTMTTPCVVGKVDRVDQRARRQAAHAHRQHLRAFGAGVVDALHHGAGGEAHHPVGDAHRDDLRLPARRRRNRVKPGQPGECAVELVAGEQAAACPVPWPRLAVSVPAGARSVALFGPPPSWTKLRCSAATRPAGSVRCAGSKPVSRWAIVILPCLAPTLARAAANWLKAAPAFHATTPGIVAAPPLGFWSSKAQTGAALAAMPLSPLPSL